MATFLPARGSFTTAVTGTAGQVARADLFIYNNPAAVPASPQEVLSKTIPSTVITTVRFNLSTWVRDYIDHSGFTTTAVLTTIPNGEWCRLQAKVYKAGVLQYTSDYACFDGYSYTDVSRNFTTSDAIVMLDEGTYYCKEGTNGGALHIYKGEAVKQWKVEYTDTAGAIINYLFTAETAKVPYVHTSNINTGGNVVKVYDDLGALVKTFDFQTVCEDRYVPVNCDFVNRYGAWQRIIFFKKKTNTLNTKSTDYNLFPSGVVPDQNKGITQRYNVNGRDSFTLNTGFVPETYGLVMEQLMLSETVRLDGKAATISTKEVVKQTHLNDQSINYQVDFMYAYDIINDSI